MGSGGRCEIFRQSWLQGPSRRPSRSGRSNLRRRNRVGWWKSVSHCYIYMQSVIFPPYAFINFLDFFFFAGNWWTILTFDEKKRRFDRIVNQTWSRFENVSACDEITTRRDGHCKLIEEHGLVPPSGGNIGLYLIACKIKDFFVKMNNLQLVRELGNGFINPPYCVKIILVTCVVFLCI